MGFEDGIGFGVSFFPGRCSLLFLRDGIAAVTWAVPCCGYSARTLRCQEIMDIHAVCEEVSKQQYYARQRYYAVCIGPESLLLLLASVLQTAKPTSKTRQTQPLLCRRAARAAGCIISTTSNNLPAA